ncbi:KRAB-A domain-containing protein 2-like [Aphelenchoides avenae]|nr:KRAB-A domain-containing protein 2-like [Aphelenchus avenae]
MDPNDGVGLQHMRALYLQKLMEIYRKKTNNSVLLSKSEYMRRMQRLLELEHSDVSKNAADFRLLKTCELITVDENGVPTQKLVRRGTSHLYVAIEDLFEVIHDAHLQLKHAGRNSLQRFFRDRYCNITKDCIMTYLHLCQDCPRKKKAIGQLNGQRREDDDDDDDEDDVLPSEASVAGANASVVSTAPLSMPFTRTPKRDRLEESFARGQVDVFDMQKLPDGEFHWIMRYTNLTTQEVRLRPLRTGTAQETADLLVDIYCEQGAPAVLQSLNGREFADEVIREVVKIWPQCRQLHGEYRPVLSSQASASPEDLEQMLLEELNMLMKRHATNSWAGMLRYLQWQINTNYNQGEIGFAEISRSPIEASIGRVPSLGLRSSKLLDAIYDKARSEEQILEFLADAELLRLSAFCHQSTSSDKRVRVSYLEDSLGVTQHPSVVANNPLMSQAVGRNYPSTSTPPSTNNSHTMSSHEALIAAVAATQQDATSQQSNSNSPPLQGMGQGQPVGPMGPFLEYTNVLEHQHDMQPTEAAYLHHHYQSMPTQHAAASQQMVPQHSAHEVKPEMMDMMAATSNPSMMPMDVNNCLVSRALNC